MLQLKHYSRVAAARHGRAAVAAAGPKHGGSRREPPAAPRTGYDTFFRFVIFSSFVAVTSPVASTGMAKNSTIFSFLFSV